MLVIEDGIMAIKQGDQHLGVKERAMMAVGIMSGGFLDSRDKGG